MKRLILMLIVMISALTISAQSYMKFRATSYAIAKVNTYSGNYTWSDWYHCSVEIIFDLRNDKIYVNSNSPQRYTVITSGSNYRDRDGGNQVQFNVIDQDGDRGNLRLRIERSGNSQLYVDFRDVAWCYNVVRIR